jgi:arylsulfatase A-like enzyme
VEFIKKYDKEQPFYLNLSFVGPHPPFWCPDDLEVSPKDMPLPLDGPDDISSASKRAHYLQKCKLIDRYIGKLADALKERGIYDDTVIIFTSDHGDCLGDHNIWGKRFFYESSVGIPFIVAGPGVVSEERQNGNRVSKLLVTQLDIYPTVLRLASVEVQNDRRRIGEDLIAMLNQERNHFRDEIFSELGTAVMIHTGNWKMVYDPEQGGVRYLFNIATDPDEMRNLAGHSGYNEIANQLIERILRSKILRSNFTHIKEESRLQQHRRI